MGSCITNSKIHTYSTRTSSDCHQYVHKLELYKSKPTLAVCNFCNKLPTYIKQIRNKCLFKRKLKELFINGSYCSTEEYMNDDFISIGI